MKTTITLTDNPRAPNMLKEPDGSIRVDSEIDIYSSKEGGVCLFFLGDSKQNFSIRLNHRDAQKLGIALGSHVEVCK